MCAFSQIIKQPKHVERTAIVQVKQQAWLVLLRKSCNIFGAKIKHIVPSDRHQLLRRYVDANLNVVYAFVQIMTGKVF